MLWQVLLAEALERHPATRIGSGQPNVLVRDSGLAASREAANKKAVVSGFESTHHGKSTDWTAVGTTGYFPEVLGFRVPFVVPVSFLVSGCPPLVMTILKIP